MNVTIRLHFPHDRFSLGWEIMYKDEEYDTNLVCIFLLILTLELEF